MKLDNLISIAICTYNRADLMREATLSCMQSVKKLSNFEILIIDNGSTDHTAEFAKELESQHEQVRYVHESKQGLSCARNTAWRVASGRYVGYLDDDALANRHWVATAIGVIENHSPEMFGGPYYAFYKGEKPAWFKDSYGSSEPGTVSGALPDDRYVCGGNMFIKKDVLKNLGGFLEELGMQGHSPGVGEETEFQIRLRRALPEAVIYYEPKLSIKHLVGRHKFSLWYHVKRSWRGGLQDEQIFHKENAFHFRIINFAKTLLQIGFLAVGFTFGVVFRSRDKYPYAQQYFIENLASRIYSLGAFFNKTFNRRKREHR